MKGAPMIDTSSKHGTNANFKKSGAPFLGGMFGGGAGGGTSMGKLMDMIRNRKFGKGPQAPAPVATPPPATPAEPAAGAPAPVAAAPEQAAPTTMNKKSKVGAPKLKGKQHKIDKNKDGKISKADFDMMKPGAPMAKPKSGPKMMAKKGGPKMMDKNSPMKEGKTSRLDKLKAAGKAFIHGAKQHDQGFNKAIAKYGEEKRKYREAAKKNKKK